MKKSLLHKRALVCGSTDGIGKATALMMADQGCEVILFARNKNKLEKTLVELRNDDNQHHKTLCANFDNSTLLEKKITSFIKNYNKPIHILINNSGGPKGGPLIEAKENEFRIAFERLLISNQIIAKAIVPGMKKLSFGRIINIISTSVNQVIPGLGVSNTIRGSVAQWAKTLAIELGEFGITVNNVLPGYTDTYRLKSIAIAKSKTLGLTIEDIREKWKNNISLQRIGKPKEIASVITFLSSDASSYITGHNLPVDGGRFGL